MTARKKSQKVHIRKPFERVRVQTMGGGECLVDQSNLLATDVNQIVKTYHRTGVMPEGRTDGVFEDVSLLQGDLTERAAWARDKIDQYNSDYQAYQDQKELERKEEARKVEEQREATQKEMERLRALHKDENPEVLITN